MSTELFNEAEADEAESDRRMDPELKAMGAILRILRDLPEAARPRVVAWIADRYRADNKL